MPKIGRPYLPIAFALHQTAGDFEQAARTIPAHNLFQSASWTSYLMAVFAVEEMFWWVQRVIRARGSGVEGPLVVITFHLLDSPRARKMRTWAAYVAVGEGERHCGVLTLLMNEKVAGLRRLGAWHLENQYVL